MEDERLPDNAAKSCSASPDRAFGDGANDKTLVQPVRPEKTMNQLVVKIELDSGICFSIDASNLDAPTTIFFAGDTSITITPSAVGEVTRDKRFNLNRRENGRRRAGFPGGKAQITRRIHYGDRFFAKQNTES